MAFSVLKAVGMLKVEGEKAQDRTPLRLNCLWN